MLNICECGEQTRIVRGDYLFLESGLNNVMLRGVELLQCDKCGTTTPVLPKINQLMRVIASAVVLKPSELTGEDIRFLRKYIGLTGEQFGRKLGLSKEHISRLENERYPVGEQTDRLIRYVALSTDPQLHREVRQLFDRLDAIKSVPQGERIDIDPATGAFEYAA